MPKLGQRRTSLSITLTKGQEAAGDEEAFLKAEKGDLLRQSTIIYLQVPSQRLEVRLKNEAVRLRCVHHILDIMI